MPASSSLALRSNRLLRAVLLMGLAGVITLIMQVWVGGATIYDPELVPKRETVHGYLLENRLPPGQTWSDHGGNSSNVRVVAVYLAEGIHRTSGISVVNSYRLIDTGALFASLLLLFVFLRQWFTETYCILGLLYVATVLPLTYFLYYFHPWDRLALLSWIAALLLLRAGQLVLLAGVLVLGVVIKFDIVLFPALFFLAAFSRERWQPVAVRTVLLFAVTFGTYAWLRFLVPGGFEPRSVAEHVLNNLRVLADFGLAYPPLLGFTLPLLLGAIGFRSADRFMRACFVFGILLAVPFFATTNFIEMRANMPILILVLPIALAGLRATLETSSPPAKDLLAGPVLVGSGSELDGRDPVAAGQRVEVLTRRPRAP